MTLAFPQAVLLSLNAVTLSQWKGLRYHACFSTTIRYGAPRRITTRYGRNYFHFTDVNRGFLALLELSKFPKLEGSGSQLPSSPSGGFPTHRGLFHTLWWEGRVQPLLSRDPLFLGGP